MVERERSGSYLTKQECPVCNSADNVAVYLFDNDASKGEADDQETWTCQTPGCTNRRTAAQARRNQAPLTYDEYLNSHNNFSKQPMVSAKTTATEKLVDVAKLQARLDANKPYDKPLRGLTTATLAQYQVKQSAEGKMLFPLLNEKGILERVKWRYPEKREGVQSFGSIRASNSHAPLFGMAAASNDRNLIITEGEIDAMSVRQMMPNYSVVSVPDGAASALKSIDNHIHWVNKFGTIFIAFDADEAGNIATDQVLKKYPEIKRIILPQGFKDPNEVLLGNAADQFKQAVYQAKSQQPQYIEEWDKLLSEVLASIDDPTIDMGLDTGVTPINALLGGWRPEETTCIFAPPGKGKSTLCRTLVFQQAIRKVNSVVVSTEETAKTWVRKLALIYGGELTEETVRGAVGMLREHVTFINPDTLGTVELLTKAIDLTIRSQDAFLVLFDNITHFAKSYSVDGNYWTTIGSLTNKLTTIAKARGAHIVTIGHITKGAARAEDPNLADADGGNSLSQFMHNVIHIDRYKQKKLKEGQEPDEFEYIPADPDKTTVLTLLKRREEPIAVDLPGIGSKQYLTYVSGTRTYLEVVSPNLPTAHHKAAQATIPQQLLEPIAKLVEAPPEVAQPPVIKDTHEPTNQQPVWEFETTNAADRLKGVSFESQEKAITEEAEPSEVIDRATWVDPFDFDDYQEKLGIPEASAKSESKQGKEDRNDIITEEWLFSTDTSFEPAKVEEKQPVETVRQQTRADSGFPEYNLPTPARSVEVQALYDRDANKRKGSRKPRLHFDNAQDKKEYYDRAKRLWERQKREGMEGVQYYQDNKRAWEEGKIKDLPWDTKGGFTNRNPDGSLISEVNYSFRRPDGTIDPGLDRVYIRPPSPRQRVERLHALGLLSNEEFETAVETLAANGSKDMR